MAYQPKSYRKFLAATATAAVVASAVAPAAGAAVKKDTTPPSIKYSGLKNNDRVKDAKQKLDVRASTDTANIKVYQNGKLIKTIKAVSGSVNVTLNEDIKKGNGYINTFNIVATDKAGNKANKVVRVYLDQIAPSIKVEGIENGKEYDEAKQSFTVRASSDVTKVVVRHNGKELKNVEYKKGDKVAVDAVLNTDIKDGLNTFSVDATDIAGNTKREVVRVQYNANPQVKSVTAINSRTLEVKFNKAIDSSAQNLKGVAVTNRTGAVDPGTLGYSLSDDGKVLTITTDGSSNKYFSGDYSVVVGFEAVKTADGKFVAPYNTIVKVSDNVAPTFTTEKVNASVVKVKFSEPMYNDIADKISFKDKNGSPIAAGTGATQIKVEANSTYTELTLTLGASIAANENITATLIGALDATGNLLTPNPATFTFQKGAADGVAPVVQSITQTGAKNFTVKFSEELVGLPTIKVGKTIANLTAGNVTQDKTDKTLYHVETSILDTDNYYVQVDNFADLSGQAGQTYTTLKAFVKDVVAPKVTSYKLVKDSTDNAEYLELTLDKDVSAGTVASSGTAVKDHVTSTLTGTSGKSVVHKDANVSKKVVKVKVADILSAKGDDIEGATYNVKLTFTGVESASSVLAEAVNVTFVRGNDTAATEVKTKVLSIKQGNDNNTVVVEFDKDVDASTATVASNYNISGATVKKAVVKAGETNKVYLTLEEDSNTFTGVRNATVSGVKAKGSTAVMDTQTIVTDSLKENVAPTVKAVKYDVVTEKFTFTFSEAVKQENANANDFEVYLDGAAVATTPIKFDAGATSTAAVTTTTAQVALSPAQLMKAVTVVGLDGSDLVDTAGNKIKFTSPISVAK